MFAQYVAMKRLLKLAHELPSLKYVPWYPAPLSLGALLSFSTPLPNSERTFVFFVLQASQLVLGRLRCWFGEKSVSTWSVGRGAEAGL